MRKRGVGKRKEGLQWSVINFRFHPRSPGTLQSERSHQGTDKVSLLSSYPYVSYLSLSSCFISSQINCCVVSLLLSYASREPSGNISLWCSPLPTGKLGKLTPNSPLENRIPSMGVVWIFSETTQFDTQMTVISHRRRERFSSSAGLLFCCEISDCRHSRGFGDKSIVFLHFPRSFRAGQLGLSSVNFDFRNVNFQPVVFPFVWGKYKGKFIRDRCISPSLGTSRLRRSLARSRVARFACPNRRKQHDGVNVMILNSKW